MKPGEFMGADGRTYRVHISLGVNTIDGWWTYSLKLPNTDPNFPAAIATLQSLLPQPSVHPAVGLRYCGEEEALEWTIGRKRYRMHDGEPQEFWDAPVNNWVWAGEKADAFVNAGREYERRQAR